MFRQKLYQSPENFTQTWFAWFATFCKSGLFALQAVIKRVTNKHTATKLANGIPWKGVNHWFNEAALTEAS